MGYGMPRPSIVQVTVVLLVALVGTMAVAAAQRVRTGREATSTAPGAATADSAAARVAAAPPLESTITVPDATPVKAEPKPKPPEPTFSVTRVKPGRAVALRSKPGGRVLASVGATTEFGSPTTLAVAATRGRWVGLTSTDLPNGKLGWVRSTDSALRAHATHFSVRIDLSRRKLELRDGRKVLRRATVGIGRPGSTTPLGRFSVTDKIPGSRYGSYYGCCIVALSGHQTSTPAGWQGGDRLAIHGTSNPGSIGLPSSAGCLRAATEDLRVLMRKVPLGTPVFIRA
jgi:lipoprotein-anchoring transpeptidase ErfK/SrfK